MSEQTLAKPGLKINKQLLFPVPLYITQFDDFMAHRQGLLDLVWKMREESPDGVKISNLNAWHSDKFMHRIDNPHVKWLVEKIGQFATPCIKDFGRLPADYKIVLVSCWANISGRSGWNAPHHHLPNHWSGVFYLDAEDSISDDPTDRTGKIEFMNPFPSVSGYQPVSGVAFKPVNGAMFLFESGLQHLVHPHFSDKERISIAFNLNIVEKTE